MKKPGTERFLFVCVVVVWNRKNNFYFSYSELNWWQRTIFLLMKFPNASKC